VAAEITAAGGEPPLVFVSDLSQRGAAARLAEDALAGLGHVDVLINNAGGGGGGFQWVVGDRDEGRTIFETNVWSSLALVQRLVPQMRERDAGTVVNVTSMSQVSTWPTMGHYSASKAALASFTQTLRLELIGSGVHVLEVIPGPVDTPVQGESRLIPGFEQAIAGVRMGSPSVLAEAIVSAIEKRTDRVVYPRSLRVPYMFPSLVRAFGPRRVSRLADELDTDDSRVRVSGSFGDELAREARAAWERGERDLSELRERAQRH
jgi:short-subunit dehydrogenase